MRHRRKRTCWASSRVGASTNASGPRVFRFSFRLDAASHSRGRRKPMVLPEPVQVRAQAHQGAGGWIGRWREGCARNGHAKRLAPVWATATTSLPRNVSGRDWAWMGVGASYFFELK